MGEKLNIVGWSPYRRVGGVTGHILAMSEIAAEYFGLNVDVRADHFGARSMESYIGHFRRVKPLSYREDFYCGPDYPDYGGRMLQYETRYCSRGKWNTNAYAYALADNLNILRPVGNAADSAFEGGSGDVCFVDSSGRNSPYSFKVLNEADIVTVFLPGCSGEIRKFFNYYSYFIHKSFFVINRFSQYDDYLFDVLNDYKVPKKNIAAIPYSPELDRACRDKSMEFLIWEEMHKRKHTEYFKSMKNLTKQVLVEARRMAEKNRNAEVEMELWRR